MLAVRSVRFRIAAARRILYRQGCDSDVGGHVSAREPGQDSFWATGFALFIFWNAGTFIGSLATHAISNPKVLGLDAAPPAAFPPSAGGLRDL